MTEITQLSQINNTRPNVRDYDATIILVYVVLAMALLIEVYFASLSPGTTPSAFESMTIFP